MIRINLLPFRAARKKEDIRRLVTLFVLSLVLVVIAAAWFNYLLSGQIVTLDKRIGDTRAQVDKYNKINHEIEEIKKKLEILNKKVEVIQSLDLTRKAPVELLHDMSVFTVEKRMWLTSLSESAEEIKVVGIALDNPTIAEYMTRIESSKRYTNVTLIAINQDDTVKGMNLKRFDIRFKKAPHKP